MMIYYSHPRRRRRSSCCYSNNLLLLLLLLLLFVLLPTMINAAFGLPKNMLKNINNDDDDGENNNDDDDDDDDDHNTVKKDKSASIDNIALPNGSTTIISRDKKKNNNNNKVFVGGSGTTTTTTTTTSTSDDDDDDDNMMMMMMSDRFLNGWHIDDKSVPYRLGRATGSAFVENYQKVMNAIDLALRNAHKIPCDELQKLLKQNIEKFVSSNKNKKSFLEIWARQLDVDVSSSEEDRWEIMEIDDMIHLILNEVVVVLLEDEQVLQQLTETIKVVADLYHRMENLTQLTLKVSQEFLST